MPSYIVSREGVTPVAVDVVLALTTGVDEIAEVQEIHVGGEATASGVSRWAIRRSTTNGVTPTTQVPAKHSPVQQAGYTQGATTFTTQPATAALPALWTRTFNAFGGVLQWWKERGKGLVIIGATAGNSEISLESAHTQVASCELVFEEQ